VCTSVDGRYLGVLEVDQLLRVLADEVEAQAGGPVPHHPDPPLD